jgi:hypothetical protein
VTFYALIVVAIVQCIDMQGFGIGISRENLDFIDEFGE